jgi:hypothetical protein
MKAGVTGVFITLSFLVSVALFHSKHRDEMTDLDRVKQSLYELKSMIGSGSQVFVVCENISAEEFYKVRYALVPNKVINAKGSLHDTMLEITSSKERYQDSVWKKRGYCLTWQHRDATYSYTYFLRK